jgi:N-acetylglutamate synthase-like GNAT family acetyltransferase
MNAIVPIPQVDVSVREATPADVPFIDSLQRMHGKAVGFFATSWIEGKIRAGQVILALDSSDAPVGYCMGVDRYQKHDDIGIIHQLNVVPGRQRGFVGATLLKAMFERAAYGCRLFCCWCAQDLDANRFWEAMGFVPLAYRAGSEKKRRVHIFWQKRIREGDRETPWWFPAKTEGGAMNADRIVFPIPPGLHWSDEMPVIMRPALSNVEGPSDEQPTDVKRQLAAPKAIKTPRVKLRARQFCAPSDEPEPEPVVEPFDGARGRKPKRACPERSRGEK